MYPAHDRPARTAHATLRMFSNDIETQEPGARAEATGTLLICSLDHLLEPSIAAIAHRFGVRISRDADGATIEVAREGARARDPGDRGGPPAWLRALLGAARARGAGVIRMERHAGVLPGLPVRARGMRTIKRSRPVFEAGREGPSAR